MGDAPGAEQGGGSRLFALGGAVLAVVVLASSVVFGAGEDLGIVRFLTGDAWLRTGDELTLVDTGSGQVKRTVDNPSAGDDYDIVQRGGVAFLVDRMTGEVCALELGATRRCTKSGVDGDAIDIVVGADRAYLLDKVEGSVRPWSVGRNAAQGPRVRLDSTLSRGVVESGGAVSTVVLDRGSLASVLNSEVDRRVSIGAGRQKYEPALVGDRLAVVNIAAGVLWWVDGSGTEGPIDLGVKDLLVPARVDGDRFVAFSPGSGELVVLEPGGSPRRIRVDVGRAGRPEVAGDTAVIPDEQTGKVVLVDLAEEKEVRREQVAGDGDDLELVSKDGRVVANDMRGPGALTVTRLGVVVTIVKFEAGDGPGGNDGNGNGGRRNEPSTDSPRRTDPVPSDRRPNDPTPNDPTPNDPTPNDPTPNDPTPNDPTPNDPTPNDPTPNDPTPNDPTPIDPVTGVPGAPTNVRGVPGDLTISVSWGPAAANGLPIEGYSVEAVRQGAGSGTGTPIDVGGSVTTVNLTGLTNNQTYDVYVTARNSAGSGGQGVARGITPVAVTVLLPTVNSFTVTRTQSGGGPAFVVNADVDNVSRCSVLPSSGSQTTVPCKGTSPAIPLPYYGATYRVDLYLDGQSSSSTATLRASWKQATVGSPVNGPTLAPGTESPADGSFNSLSAVIQCYEDIDIAAPPPLTTETVRYLWVYVNGGSGWARDWGENLSSLQPCSGAQSPSPPP